MQYYLRFLCYDEPSRETYQQIHEDIPIEEPPKFSYGKALMIGPDEDDPKTWPVYVVAHISFMEEIVDPLNENKKALLFKYFVARLEEFSNFSTPEIILEIMEESEKEELL
ncbi:hypothetical protein [Spirosoma endbachense]|uniref:Uncharacterized protein n=1 Tax=Spirosoma endbachense TaxID=2666025 RepID=A0A6P1W2I4_9BACT|nr:hypothetical protein [Spirosoma endbachense]QHV97886.1 hypothetical protein GJR95_24035 [Spirosoma endbachense]